MGFRKAGHESQMPYVVMRALDPMGPYGTLYPCKEPPRLPLESEKSLAGFSKFQNVSFEQVMYILKLFWEKATEDDGRATVALLESRSIGITQNAFLRLIQPNLWAVGRLPTRVPVDKFALSYAQIPKKGISPRKMGARMGICPRCNQPAENKNRHNNGDHGETCILNRMREIIEG